MKRSHHFPSLTHPETGIGFAEDSLQLGGEMIAAVAGIAATLQLVRNQAPGHPLISSTIHEEK